MITAPPILIIIGLSAIATVIYLLLIPAILINNLKSNPHRYFGLYLFFSALAAGGLFFAYSTSNQNLAEIAYIFLTAPSIFAAAAYYLFIRSLNEIKFRNQEELLIILFLTIIFALVTTMYGDYVSKGVFPSLLGQVVKSPLTGLFTLRYGGVSYLFVPISLTFLVLSWHLALKLIITTRSIIETERFKYLFIGASLILVSYLKSFIPISVISDLPTEVPTSLVNVILITYAITRYQLLNVNTLLAKAIFFINLTILITGLYLAVGILVQRDFILEGISLASTIATAALITLTYQPLSNIVRKLANKLAISQSYDVAEFSQELANNLASLTDTESLQERVTKVISKAINVDRVEIILKIPENLKITEATTLIDSKDKIAADFMLDNKFEVISPIIFNNKTVGLLALGGKKNQRPYDLTDLNLISTASSHLAIALENSRNFEEVIQSSKLKDEFITIASAHLRTPITAMSGYLDYLLGKRGKITNNERQNLIEHVKANSERLAALIDELLTISALEHGKIKIIPQDVQLESLVEEVANSLFYFATEHRVSVKFSTPDPPLPKVYLDSAKIREAVANILSNAIKFNKPAGAVTISLERKDNNALIIISDTGIGIPKKEMPRLFQKFHRIGQAPEGVGLGLYIAKLIVEAHNGRIEIDSEESKGTKVTITLPLSGYVPSQVITEPGKILP